MRGILSTGEPQNAVTGERLLAYNVIWSGIIDMVSRHPVKQNRESACVYRNRCSTREHKRSLAYEFLTGQTPITRYWFEVAGIEPMEGTAKRVQEYLRENIIKCGIKQLGVPV